MRPPRRPAIPRIASCMGMAAVLSCSGARPSPAGPVPQGPIEAFVAGADLDAASAAIGDGLSSDPKNPLLLWMAGEVSYLKGDMDTAMDAYASAVVTASGWDDPIGDPVAEASLEAMLSLDRFAPRWEDRVGSLLNASMPALYRNTDGAWFTALEAEVRALARAGRFEESVALMDQGGCLTHWRAIGPMGPTEIKDFDEVRDPEMDLPWKAAYPLVPGGEPKPTASAHSWFCRTTIEPEDTYTGGTYYAAADLSVPSSGDFVFRMSSQDTYSVIVDGATVWGVDRRTTVLPGVSLFKLRLAAGEHRLMVKIGTRDIMPTFTLLWKEASSSAPDPADAPSITSREHGEGLGGLAAPPDPAEPIGLPASRSPVEDILAAQIALLHGDNVGSGSIAGPMAEAHPGSAPLLALVATLAGSDPFVPWPTRMNRMRALAETMVEAHPESWVGWYIVSQIESNLDRTENAIEMLKIGTEAIPGFAGFEILLASMYASKGWTGEAIEARRAAAGMLDGSCCSLDLEYSNAVSMGDLDGMEDAARKLSTCDATDGTLLLVLEQRGKWDDARVEQERLHALFPDRDENLVDDALIALELGDVEAHAGLLGEFGKEHPTSWAVLGQLVDAEAAAGRTGEAVAILARARAISSGPGDDLLTKIALIEGFDYLYPFRRDAVSSIAAFEAANEGETIVQGTPSIEILDHVTHRIYEDGSTLTRYHSVRKLLTKEGVEAGSDFAGPPGAALVRLRTIKPDGHTLLPEDIEGKGTISFPSLEPGDCTEAEWLQATGPSSMFPGGFTLDRWFFQVFDQVLFHSEVVIVAPKGMGFSLDPRGTPPPGVKTEAGALEITTLTAERSPHVKGEPGSPAWSEFLPSIRLSRQASWGSYFSWIADVLTGTHIASPAMAGKVAELTAGIPQGDREARARAIFRWVNDEVEEGEGLDTPASYIFEDRMGLRVRLLYALLVEAGLHPELWAVRSAFADHTETEVADMDVYTQLAVRIGDDWLVPGVDGLPYGLLAPYMRGEEAVRILPEIALGKTPPASSFDDGIARKLAIVVQQDGTSSAVLTDTFRGIPAAIIRAGLREMEASDVEMQMEGSYLAFLFNGATMTGFELPDLESDSTEVEIEIAFDMPPAPGPLPGTVSLGPFLKTRLSQAWTSLPSRVFPLLVEEPTEVSVEVTIDTVGMWDVFQPPVPSTHLSTPWGGSFDQSFARSGEYWILTRNLVLPAGRVSPEDYPTLLDFATRVDESEGSVFILVPNPMSMPGK